ncbi:integral membrane protein [Mycolicibacterium conceptionense]|uniref:Integral membrane protein n=1 Tax=Mycolicibacterium conceptionense TaxID=451644 RepID=A0A0U1DIK3_9MYCO|nr:integral membrane protein [Mycolicibacterium conceptionense]
MAVRPHDRGQTRHPARRLIGNIIWVLLFGIWLAIGHLVSAAAMAVTIIGIPLALADLKMIPVSLVPLGKEIVPVDSLKAAV